MIFTVLFAWLRCRSIIVKIVLLHKIISIMITIRMFVTAVIILDIWIIILASTMMVLIVIIWYIFMPSFQTPAPMLRLFIPIGIILRLRMIIILLSFTLPVSLMF